jgi:hypothetical protein
MFFPNKIDRVIIRAILKDAVDFDDTLPKRFASVGDVRLYKPVVGSRKWAILFGHDERDHGVDLGFYANMALNIASKYYSKSNGK